MNNADEPVSQRELIDAAQAADPKKFNRRLKYWTRQGNSAPLAYLAAAADVLPAMADQLDMNKPEAAR